MFDRSGHERTSPPRENALCIVFNGYRLGVWGDRLITIAGVGDIPPAFAFGAPLFLAEAEAGRLDRAAAAALAAEHVELLVRAGDLNWTRRSRFCSACGSADVRQGGHVRAAHRAKRRSIRAPIRQS
jgi:hypothetical protein